MPQILTILLLVCLLLPGGTAQGQTGVSDTEVKNQPLISLWRIQTQHSTVYLLGSIHALTSDLYPLSAEIERAFLSSDNAVFEVDMNKVSSYESAVLMTQKGIYNKPESLETELSATTLKSVDRYLTKNGLSLNDYKQMRPWLLSLRIGMMELAKIGFKPEYGIDLHFQKRARSLGKPILQLESFREQIELLAADPPEVQDLALKVGLQEIDEIEVQVQALIAAWQQGDANLMYDLSVQSIRGFPNLMAQMRRLLDHRNVKMAKKIQTYLTTGGSYFVVIGALHMGGPVGLLSLLGKDHEIEQLHHSRE